MNQIVQKQSLEILQFQNILNLDWIQILLDVLENQQDLHLFMAHDYISKHQNMPKELDVLLFSFAFSE